MTIQKCFEQLIGYVADQREALEKGRAIDDTDLYNIDVLLVRLQDQCAKKNISDKKKITNMKEETVDIINHALKGGNFIFSEMTYTGDIYENGEKFGKLTEYCPDSFFPFRSGKHESKKIKRVSKRTHQ